jgi:hypothetical protein
MPSFTNPLFLLNCRNIKCDSNKNKKYDYDLLVVKNLSSLLSGGRKGGGGALPSPRVLELCEEDLIARESFPYFSLELPVILNKQKPQ